MGCNCTSRRIEELKEKYKENKTIEGLVELRASQFLSTIGTILMAVLVTPLILLSIVVTTIFTGKPKVKLPNKIVEMARENGEQQTL